MNDHGEDKSEIEEIESKNDKELEHQRPERHGRPPVRYGLEEYIDTAKDHVNHVAYCHNIEPKTMEEALNSEHGKEWKEVADSEYSSLIENKTWELVKLPKSRKAIGCKWVFKGNDGKIDQFKGRLVAKGYALKYGVDYDKTFSPVVHFSSIRALLAFAVQNDMLIYQMNVVTAFLNGQLEKEIYMEQQEGYIKSGNENLICKLNKSLYGLKKISDVLKHSI